jgi:hypothetical protein
MPAVTAKTKGRLTKAQQAAYAAILKRQEKVFANFWDPATQRQISKATLRALADKGVIELVRIQEHTSTTRSSVGWNRHVDIVAFYRLASQADQ